MKHPLWILNSTLLFIVLVALGVMALTYQYPPEREDIEPSAVTLAPKAGMTKIGIEKIYDRDPFGLYRPRDMNHETQQQGLAFPTPPSPTPIEIPEQPRIFFLEPLSINLKGIMTFALDESKNRAIIEKTSVEKMYKVGDMIEDAQLLRISNNKVIFVRSNGQQEVVYLREKDAVSDPSYANVVGWAQVIQPLTPLMYTINTNAFTERVSNLGQLIDMLDLSTVYKKGESVGCRIGSVEEHSLAHALGLRKGDIVTSVNGIPTTSNQQRFTIYKNITSMENGGSVEVVIVRNGRPIVFEYQLEMNTELVQTTVKNPSIAQSKTYVQTRESGISGQQLAPTFKDIRAKERQLMKEHGKQPATSLSPSNE